MYIDAKVLRDAIYATVMSSLSHSTISIQFAEAVVKEMQVQEMKRAMKAWNEVKITDGEEVRVTATEVREAFDRRGWNGPNVLINDIMKHREPEWETGDLALANDGKVVQRTADGAWKEPGASDNVFNRWHPAKPLKLIGKAV